MAIIKKKKGLMSTAAGIIAAAGAVALGGLSTPAGQEVSTAVQNTQQQVVQKAMQGKQARANQQQQMRHHQQRIATNQGANYLPWRPGYPIYGKFSLSPKEYGEYLMRSGKDKYNKRSRKHWAKAFS